MITVKEARKILKNKGQNLSDKEIESIVSFLYGISEKVIGQTVQTRLDTHVKNPLEFKYRAI